MKAEKLTHQLEKVIAKLEGFHHRFQKDENQTDFDTMRSDALATLNEMLELTQEDAESEEEEGKEEQE